MFYFDRMTIQQFEAATRYVQKAIVKFHGNFLLKRTRGSQIAKLYQLDGFYVEVTDSLAPKASSMQTCSVEEIDDYLSQIDISFVHRLLK